MIEVQQDITYSYTYITNNNFNLPFPDKTQTADSIFKRR